MISYFIIHFHNEKMLSSPQQKEVRAVCLVVGSHKIPAEPNGGIVGLIHPKICGEMCPLDASINKTWLFVLGVTGC